jgi:glycosyltransferase involved in cell wall biosynthesis
MKVLVIAPQPFFSPRGTPFSVYYRALVMSQMGIKIDLLTYGEGLDVDMPGVTIHRIPRFGMFGNVKIGPSLLKLFLDLFLFFKVFLFLCKHKYAIVHAHEEAVFFCAMVKPLFGFKLIYDMHSSLSQQLVNFQFTSFKPLIRLFEVLEKRSLEASDVIISICPDLALYVNRLVGDRKPHVMIENSIFETVRVKGTSASSESDSVAVDPEVAQWRQQSLPIVVYCGTLEPYQGIDTLIRSFQLVLRRTPEARLLIVGGTPEQVQGYLELAASLKIRSAVRFTGKVPQQVARELTKSAQVQVSPRSTGTNTPLKIYEQLASGIPIVATDIYSHTQAIDADVAFLVEPNPEDMAHGIHTAMTDKVLSEKKIAAAKALYARKYARPIYEQKLRTVLHRVAGDPFGSVK